MKFLITVSSILLILSLAQPSLAHDPDVTIDRIQFIANDGNVVVEVPFFPFTILFEGSVFHDGQGNLNTLFLSGAVNNELFYGPQPLNGSGNTTITTYAMPWVVYAPGQYSITVYAEHRNDQQPEREFCKAAPAVAVNYVHETERLHAIGGLISAVAHATGKKGALWAKEKCRDEYVTQTIEIIHQNID